MTEKELRALLQQKCEKAGSQRDWCRSVGANEQSVSHVLHQRRPPQPALLKAMGLRRVVSYERARRA